jgi:carbamoylphosphate synthase small subunit
MLSIIGTFIYEAEGVDKRKMTRALRARGMTRHGLL